MIGVVLQVGEGFFGVAGSVEGRSIGEDDLAGFVGNKGLAAGHKELAGYTDGADFLKVGVAVAEAAGFPGADHAFIFGVKENHEIGFAEIIGAVENLAVLVGQAERGNGVADGEGVVAGGLAAGGGG